MANRFLVLYYLPCEGSWKLGVSVSSRLGKATVRNKLRRRVKEAYRQLQDEVSAEGQLVFVIRRQLRYASFCDIQDAMRQLLKRMELLEC